MSREKVRLYQLARELGVDSKDLLDLLHSAGTDIKNHMTTMDAETRQLAIDLVSGKVTPSVAKRKSAAAAPTAEPGPIPDPRGRKVAEIVRPAKVEEKPAEQAAPPPEPTPEVVAPAAIVEPVVEAPPEIAATQSKPAAPAKPPAAQSKPAGQAKPVAEAKAVEPVKKAAPPPPEQPPPEPPPVAPVSAEPVAPKKEQPIPVRPKSPSPIPAPSKSGVPSIGGKENGPGKSDRPSRPRGPSRPNVVVAPMPSMSKPAPPRKEKQEAPAQRPAMKLSDALRDGRVKVPEGLKPPPPPIPPEGPPARWSDDDSSRRPGTALAGREERQRRRGQRAAQKRQFDDPDGDDAASAARRGIKANRRRIASGSTTSRGAVAVTLPITVRAFSEAAGIRAKDMLRKLMDLGIMATINHTLVEEEAQMLAMALEIELKVKKGTTAEDLLEQRMEAEEDDPADLVPRPPIVTFMGHVDHGKTSLMDRIRQANVVATESGGITQHIGAYQVKAPSEVGAITFLDTPGHEAFTAMRARGANVTDIVVLVVAADDGVMPQTEEAINHAKAAKVKIVVAINKIDLPGVNTDRVKTELARHGLNPEEWGGDTIMVGTSALTGAGVDELLESLAAVAELEDLKANPTKPATGMCIEASLSEGRGVQSTMLVLDGTLRPGDVVLCGAAFGRTRAMFDEHNQSLREAGPATPVVLSGLDVVPHAGERFVVVDDVSKAREIAETRRARGRAESASARHHVTLENLFDTLKSRKLGELLLIVKADVRGSLEAIRKEVSEFSHTEVRVRIIHDGIGGIGESDVLLADASDAIIIGFRVAADERATELAREKGVDLRRYDIIYQVTDDIKKGLEGMLEPERREVQLGRAVVRELFKISQKGTIAGCHVVQGTIERSAKVRIVRDGTIVGAYGLETLRRFKDDVREVREGLECGMKLESFNDVKVGDVLEAFKMEEIKRTL